MYGRCATDPFDQATDVCDSCFGEFCSACLVRAKGRKHPICKECTIIASGVRPGAKPLLRGSKKTAAKRRKALREAPVVTREFEYFDDAATAADDDPGPEAETETGTRAGTEASAEGPAPSGHDEPIDDPTAPEPTEVLATPVDAETMPASADADRPGVEAAGLSPDPPTPSARAVTPGLAALAQHQAERRGEPVVDDPASVPAPDWLTDQPIEGSDPFGETPPAVEVVDPVEVTEPVAQTGDDRPRIDAGAKPVTEGFDWVTEMPARGTTKPLPSRSRSGDGASTGTSPVQADGGRAEQPAGAVATADRQPAALPRRRSKLRPDDQR